MTLVLLAICLLFSLLLSGAESAILSVSRVRARHAAEGGNVRAKKLVRLLERREELLQVVATTNHLCGLVAFTAAALTLVRVIGPWGWLVALLLALPVFVIGLELLPKLLFRRYPFAGLCRLVGLLELLMRLARPWLALSKRLRPKALDQIPAENDPESLAVLTDTLVEQNVFPQQVVSLLRRFTTFQQFTAKDVMVPLRQLSALPPHMPLANALGLAREVKQPWHAVLGEDGALLGWLDTSTIPSNPRPDKVISQYLRPFHQIPVTHSALQCLQILRKRQEPLAEIVDSAGLTLGVITQQDLKKQLFNHSSKATPP